MEVVIHGADPPGRRCGPNENVHVGLIFLGKNSGVAVPGRPWRVVGLVPGDTADVRWECEITVKTTAAGTDFAGPFVRGNRDDRHLGLAWVEVHADGTLEVFRGAKLRLDDVDPEILRSAGRPGHRLVARVSLGSGHGEPRCARIRPPDLECSAE